MSQHHHHHRLHAASPAPVHWGSQRLWRQEELAPTINRPIPTGPLLYTDVRIIMDTGHDDNDPGSSTRAAYALAAQSVPFTPETRMGDYVTRMDAVVSEAIRTSSCHPR
jgi:hypothetical protein